MSPTTIEEVDRYQDLLGLAVGRSISILLPDGDTWTRKFVRLVWRDGQPLALVTDDGFVPWVNVIAVSVVP